VRITSLDATFDLNCTEVPITFANERISGPISIPIGPDFRFSHTEFYSDADSVVSLGRTLLAIGTFRRPARCSGSSTRSNSCPSRARGSRTLIPFAV